MINIIKKKINPKEYVDYFETIYDYKGNPVPRVTHILQDMLHEDKFMDWANYLGFKRQNYRSTLQLAADKGTYVHNAIEDYVQNNNNLDFSTVENNCRDDVYNAYNAFLIWWESMLKNGTKVLMQEFPLVGKYFAGTLDMLIEVHDKIYLVDFKTSNYPSYKHFLQLSAYRYLLRELHNIEIDGCGILLLNKKEIDFTEIFVDIHEGYNLNFINHCQETFFSLVYAYYNRLRVEEMFKEVLKQNELRGISPLQ